VARPLNGLSKFHSGSVFAEKIPLSNLLTLRTSRVPLDCAHRIPISALFRSCILPKTKNPVILRFNILQVLEGVVCVAGSLLGYGAAYLFFRYVPTFIAHQFRLGWPSWWFVAFSLAMLVVVTISGYRLWKTRGGFYGYHESAVYHDFGGDSGGGTVVDFYAHRITGPAYMLGQVFAAGPLLALRALRHFRNLIPSEFGLETRLGELLARLRQLNKWQGLREYPDEERDILLLVRMRKIDFSARKGEPRFRAFPEYGA
jgi:hypothetical protein